MVDENITGGENLSVAERRARRKRRRREEQAAATQNEAAVESDASGVTAKKGTITRKQTEVLKERSRGKRSGAENLPVVGRAVTYFQGVVAEIQKVTWPTREEARRLTGIVLAVTVAFSIALGIVDALFGVWFREGLENTATFIIIAIPVVSIGSFLSWRFILREE